MYKSLHIKVYPYCKTNIKVLKIPQKNNKKYLCLCKIFSTATIINRILGTFPYTWKHDNGTCTYEISFAWVTYSLILIASLAIASTYLMPSWKFNISNLPVFLDSLTNLLGSVYVCLSLLHLFNMNVWFRIVQGLNKVNKDFLFCQQSRNIACRFQKNMLLCIVVMAVLENAAFIILNYWFATGLSLHILFFRNLHTMPVMCYMFWFSCKYFV